MALFLLLLPPFLACYLQADDKKTQLPSDINIREMLHLEDNLGGERAMLRSFGERAFPAYLRILATKDVDSSEICGILGLVRGVKADRSQFLEYAISGLSNVDASVRLSAVILLAEIGSIRDAAPVVALLSDTKWEIPFAAATTLAAIGDRRTLVAMDVWLNSSIHRANAAEYEAQRKHVIKCRDELKQRLEKEKLEKEKPPGK